MHLFARSDRRSTLPLLGPAALAATLAVGCASPGPPHAPSLHLPQPVRDLSVQRIGDTVELHFTAPATATDKVPLRGPTIPGQLCRQLPHQPCIAVPSSRTSVAIAHASDGRARVTWIDHLPPALTHDAPQLLAYRVEFFSPTDRSAGLSTPAFTASGPAPSPVENLHATGSRLGIILQWDPSTTPGEVILRRDDLAPAKPKHAIHETKPATTPLPSAEHGRTTKPATRPARSASNPESGIAWLQTQSPDPAAPQQNLTLDTAALPDTPYRYSAQRRSTLQLADHSIDLRSDLSAPIDFTLLKIYPPPTPTGLTAAGFFNGTPPTFAVDLVWQPVDEAGLIAPLAGYNLYRELSDAPSTRTRLNTSPILLPAFHDTTADPAKPYRYTITAIDTKGNESPSTTILLPPTNQP